MADPFETVKNEVKESLGIVRALSQRYTEILNGPSHPDEAELQWTKKEFEKMARRIDFDVQDLEETVEVVERNPERWTHVDEEDMRQRKTFIAATKRDMRQMKEQVLSKGTEAKWQGRKKDMLMAVEGVHHAGPSAVGGSSSSKGAFLGRDRYDKLEDDIAHDNQEFIDQQLLVQQNTMREQDTHIDHAMQSVDRVKHITLDMHDELDDQHRSLGKLSREVEGVQGLLKRTQKRLNKLLKNSKDRGKLIAIVFLIIVLMALVVILFSVRF